MGNSEAQRGGARHGEKLSDDFIRSVVEATNILDVVGPHVELRQNGSNHKGLCPFHSEKSPSFTVAEDKQFYHCFGCGKNGDALKFLIEYSGMSFIDAIKRLAGEAGIAMPAFGQKSDGQDRINPVLFRLMETAATYYQEELIVSPLAISYLLHRGIRPATALRFGLGFAPDGWQNLATKFSIYDGQELQLCGLTARGNLDRVYDRFRNRLMFPILAASGEVIGFGGRTMTDEEPKYLNSPETALFDKGRELFGLSLAAREIRASLSVLVVEGYMDVITVSQAGMVNVVGTMGTATTPMQAKKLLRMADTVVFCFDGDKAGVNAAWRALEACIPFLRDTKVVRFVFLPDDEDPDSFIRKHGLEAFKRYCDHGWMLSDYLLKRLQQGIDLSAAEGRAKLIHEAKPFLGRLKNKHAPLLRLQLLKSLSELTKFTTSELDTLCEGDTSD